MTTVATRTLYVDSETNQTGNGTNFRLNVPPSSFSCKPNQVMKLTLTNFEMRKNWYEINNANNVFWLKATQTGVTKYFPIVIPPGSYRAFGTTNTTSGITNTSAYSYANNDLCSALAYAFAKTFSSIQLNTALTDSTGATTVTTLVPGFGTNFFSGGPNAKVDFNTVTRKFTISVSGVTLNNGSLDALVYLQAKNGVPSTHAMSSFVAAFKSQLYGDPSFQDSYEILGGKPTRDVDLVVSSTNIADSNTFTTLSTISPYVGQLNSLEAIYIRLLSAGTNNFQSPGLDRNVQNTYGLVPTNIFARIPLPGAIYDDAVEILTFTEPGNGIFSCIIDARQMQIIEFSITDDKGRYIQEVLSGQAASGDLSAKLTIKWEIIQFDQSLNSLPPSMDIIKSLNPVGLIRPSTDLMPPSTDREVKAKRKISQPAFAPKMALLNN